MAYKILVTGSEGQLGNYLTSYLSNDFEVIGTSKKGNLRNNIKKVDINNHKIVNDAINKYKPNIIINTAAITNVDYCETNKKESNDTNVNGLKNLISCSDIATKIIHFSSDYIFDGTKGNYNEKSYPNPLNYYGKTKLEAENLLIGSNRDYLIVRISTLFSNEGINLFTWIYKTLLSNNKLNVISDQVSNPSYVPFLAKSLVDMIILNGQGTFHYGTSNEISKYDFALLVAKHFNFNDSFNACKSY